MEFYLKGWQECFNYRGRTGREEFWMFNLFSLILAYFATILDDILISFRYFRFEEDYYASVTEGLAFTLNDIVFGPFYFVFITLSVFPALAITVRRLHDVGKSGWMMLLPLIPLIGTVWLIVLMLKNSDANENKFGQGTQISDEDNESRRDSLVLSGVILIIYGLGGHYIFLTTDLMSFQFEPTSVYFAYTGSSYEVLTHIWKTLDLSSVFGIGLLLLSLRSKTIKGILFTLLAILIAWVWFSYSYPIS
ncbi:Inner membrane protein YhaH [Grimontia celer]|uniref:Inner membrane protein YhaH n=1 Tax=Grimontia celer TaxID=1796497 RepID=A0A128FAA2_9GAMM|nr:DUF805 domain-containing protein [Grimontia celer]CZF83236.1 Inner membrane protein YhaH [Grimontia celer]